MPPRLWRHGGVCYHGTPNQITEWEGEHTCEDRFTPGLVGFVEFNKYTEADMDWAAEEVRATLEIITRQKDSWYG